MEPLDRDLLASATGLLRDGHAAAAVVAAHAATEVISEFVIERLLGVRGVPELAQPLRRLARFHLTNPHARNLYEVLSDDAIGTTPLWESYSKHCDRRNKAAHGAASISIADGEDSVAVCGEMVTHLLNAWADAVEETEPPATPQ
jgi:hypothetical protein